MSNSLGVGFPVRIDPRATFLADVLRAGLAGLCAGLAGLCAFGFFAELLFFFVLAMVGCLNISFLTPQGTLIKNNSPEAQAENGKNIVTFAAA
jgi:hypothetical protein